MSRPDNFVGVSMRDRDFQKLSEIVRATRLTAQEVLRRLVRRHHRSEFENGPPRAMQGGDIGLSTNHHF